MSLERTFASPEERFDHDAALAACAVGDASALRRLYDREAANLVGIAVRILRRRDLAHDVVHDAFVQIWQRAQTFDPSRGSGRTWMISVVRHQCFKVLRRASRESALDHAARALAAEALLPAEAQDAFARLGAAQEARALHRCLEQLERPKREAILLAYVDGLTQSQIADHQGVPLGTVKAWVRRGLLSLRECLG